MFRSIQQAFHYLKSGDETTASLKENIDVLKKSTEELSGKIESLNENMDELKNQIIDVSNCERKQHVAHSKSCKEFNDTLEDLKKNLVEFQMNNNNFSNIVQDKIDSLVSKAVSEQINRLKVETKSYNNLKDNINILVQEMSKSQKELARFREISEKLKNKDFEMQKMLIEFNKARQEQMQIVKENEKLRRMIATERRKSNKF